MGQAPAGFGTAGIGGFDFSNFDFFQDFINPLLAGPLLPLLGFATGGLPRGLLGLAGGKFFSDIGAQNVQQQGLVGDIVSTVGGTTAGAGNIAPSFNFGLGGETLPVGPTPTPDSPAIDLDLSSIFDVGQQKLDFFRSQGVGDVLGAQIDPIDITGIEAAGRGRIEDLVSGGQLTGADLLEGVDLPSTDLSEVLGAELAGIGAASRKSLQFQQQQLAGQAGAFGGLENLQRQAGSLGFEEAITRGTQAAQAQGRIRLEEAQRETDVAQIQFGAGSVAEQINAALLNEQIQQEGLATGRLSQAEIAQRTVVDPINLMRQDAAKLAEMGAIGEAEQDEVNAALLVIDTGFKSAGIESNVLGQVLAGQIGLAQALGGSGLLTPQIIDAFSVLERLLPDVEFAGGTGKLGSSRGFGGRFGAGPSLFD